MSDRRDFNRGWFFARHEAEWPDDFAAAGVAMEPVTLPHTWNAEDMVVGGQNPYVGSGWYRKHFAAPPLRAGQRLLVELEGVTNCHKVWVNSGYAGGRNGGFLPTLLDITDFLAEGDNEILVRADNRYELAAAMPRNVDWNRYGGITRPVWLWVREHAYLASAGVEVRTPRVTDDAAETVVVTHVQEERVGGGALKIRHTLIGPDGEVVSTTTSGMATHYGRTNSLEVTLPKVVKPALWSDVRPALYVLQTEVLEGGAVIDSRSDRIGYRFYRFDAEEGFVLNGKPTQLRGANIHIFFPGLGNAVPARIHRGDMALMKRMGCNYMRASHYPRAAECLDACDELGILVLEEQPYWHGSVRATGGEAAVDNAPRLIEDMVRHHRNHPSIIAWNTVNEVMLAPAYKPGVGHLEPGDPRRAAWAINPKEYPYIRRHLQKMVDAFKRADPDRPVSVVVGGGWEKNDEAGMTAVADVVAYNGGALNLMPDFVGPKTGKRYAFRPDYYREIHPQRVHLMSEGVLNDVCFARGDWEAEERAWRNNARYWEVFGARRWFCGGSMWCFTDYSANGMIRLHGVVDEHRLEKDLFYFYEAMWADHPVLHILGHWNDQAGALREVVVFTNCDHVELAVNGRSLGAGVGNVEAYPHLAHVPVVWGEVAFEPGELKAVGQYGEQVVCDRRVTAGAAAKIVLRASNEELAADGRDISLIDAVVCDAEGNRCYTQAPCVRIGVSGAAKLAGPGELPAPAGLARFAIRSTGQAGEITVAVAGEGMGEAKLHLISR